MKKRIFSIIAIAAVVMSSCKKEEINSTQLEDAIIKGNVYSDLDYSNDLVNGSYVQGSVKEGVEGMIVSVEVNTYNWDQTPDNSYNYDKKTYTATTDANGDYTLTIPATDDGYNVSLSFAAVYKTRSIYTTDGSALTEEVVVNSFSRNAFIYKGAALNLKDDRTFGTNTVTNNVYEYGTATIRGTVYGSWDVGVSPTNDAVGSPMIGKTIKLKYTSAPQGMGVSTIYSATIDANGEYSIVVPTNESGNFNYIAIEIFTEDFIANQIFNNGGVDGNRDAIYSGNNNSVTWFYDGDIKIQNFFFSVSPI